MPDFQTIGLTDADEALLSRVRALDYKNGWSTSNADVVAYRDRLMELQSRRCGYCQGPIESTANGYRELDHILPKKPNGKDPQRIASNEFKDRHVTWGYPHFTFEPMNIVLSCRQCNSVKGTFDPYRDRETIPLEYPQLGSNDVTWFNPHVDRYSDHIYRTPQWTFVHVTEKGDYTIRACKLDVLEELKKRFLARAEANLAHSGNIRDALYALATSIRLKHYGLEQAITALSTRCALSEEEARDLIEKWVEHVSLASVQAYEKANAALACVGIVWEFKNAFDQVAEGLGEIAEESKLQAREPRHP